MWLSVVSIFWRVYLVDSLLVWMFLVLVEVWVGIYKFFLGYWRYYLLVCLRSCRFQAIGFEKDGHCFLDN